MSRASIPTTSAARRTDAFEPATVGAPERRETMSSRPTAGLLGTLATSDVRSLLVYLILFLCVFPYFSPVRLDVDTSPLYPMAAVLLAAVGLIRAELTLPLSLWIVVTCWLFLGTGMILKAALFSDPRSLRLAAGFLLQAILLVAVGAAFSGPEAPRRMYGTLRFLAAALFWGAVCWSTAAALQLLSRFTGSAVGTNITHLFVTAARTTEGRGITSLAAEPSFAGITCCFLAAACWTLKGNGLMPNGRARIAITGYLLVTLLTVSLTSYIALGIFGFLVARKLTAWIALVLVLAAAFMFVPWNALQDLRVVHLVRTLMSNPALMLADFSTASRAADIASQFLALRLPGGLWGHLADESPFVSQELALQSMHNSAMPYLLAALQETGPHARAMSSLGSLALLFGVWGLALYGYEVLAFATIARMGRMRGVGTLLCVGTFGYLVQLPFSFPSITAILVVLCLFALNGSRLTEAGLAPYQAHTRRLR